MATNTKKVTDIVAAANNEKLKIKLSKPFTFEGKEYTEIDLSHLEEMNYIDLKECDLLYSRIRQGKAVTKEIDTDYIFIVAAKALNVPMEFFTELSFKDSTKVELKIRNFLFV